MNNPWTKLETPQADISVLRVSATHPLPLFWGKDTRGNYNFLAEIPTEVTPPPKDIPELNGIRTDVYVSGKTSKIVFTLNDIQNWELFLSLCSDMINASEKAESPASAVRFIVRRLIRWRDFLKRPRSEAMTEGKVKGLIGELLFLERHLAEPYGWEAAVSFWKGPEGAPQDYAIHDTAVEVKCQSGSSRPSIEITSIEQLNAQLPRLYIAVQTLSSADADDPERFTLNSLVKRIQASMEFAPELVLEAFETLLFQAGWAPIKEYDEKSYCLLSTNFFEVRDQFPRLTSESIPEGVEKVTYSLSLDALAPFATDLTFPIHSQERFVQ